MQSFDERKDTMRKVFKLNGEAEQIYPFSFVFLSLFMVIQDVMSKIIVNRYCVIKLFTYV